MIISQKHGFVFICMPKCASTSSEEILRPFGDIVTGSSPGYKHMTYRKYQTFLEPLVLAKLSGDGEPSEERRLFWEAVEWLRRMVHDPFVLGKSRNNPDLPEVVCLFREPVDWLYSWYRYRQRGELQRGPNLAKSTRGMSFEEFAGQYASGQPAPPARVGRQLNMLKDRNGNIGKITLFRYENYDGFLDYMSAKVGKRLEAPVLNQSPMIQPKEPPELPFLREYLRAEYDLYNSIPNR